MQNSDNEPKNGVEVKDMKAKPKRKWEKQPLSHREQRFIKAITEIGAETYGLPQKAALAAGYVEGQVEHTARRLMANPKILIAIDLVYAKRMEGSPTNIARVMSNLDNTEAIALKAKSMPTLTRIEELRGKYLDLWNSNSPPDAEKEAELLAHMSEEQKRICRMIALCLTSSSEGSPEVRGELRRMIINHPELVFPEKVKKAAG